MGRASRKVDKPGFSRSGNAEITGVMRRRGLWLCAFVFFVALLVRVFYLCESSDNPTFEAPIVDAQGYDQLARLLVGSKVIPKEIFWRGFFYPFFLSVVYFFSGSSIVFAKVVQIVLGSFTCVLVYKVGEAIFSRKTGVLAGIIAAFYGPLIFYDGELLATCWAAFWSVALVLLLLKAADARSRWFYFLLGLCGGLSAVARIVFLPFLVVGFLWLVIVLRRSSVGWRFIGGALLSAAAGFCIIATPVAIQNFRVTGIFSIQPSNGSLNLYLGNNPDMCATLTARPGPDYTNIMNLPRQHGVKDARGEQRFFYEKVVSYAVSEPFDFIKGLAGKALQFINSREIPNTCKLYLFREWSVTLRVLVWKIGRFGFPFGVLLPLAVVGLIYCRSRRLIPLLLFLFLYSLSIILVHVNDRYRLPVVPAMCIPAACGCLVILEALRLKQWRRLIVILVCSAATVLPATLPGPFCLEKLNYEPELYYGVGNYRQMQGRTDEAIANYIKALGLKSDYAEAHNNLAATYLRVGEIDKAVEHYAAAVRFRPNLAAGHQRFADALVQQGNLDEAVNQYEQALQLNPDMPRAHECIARILVGQGKIAEAVGRYRQVLKLNPDSTESLNNLAWMLATSEDKKVRAPAEAVHLAQRACELTGYQESYMLDTLAAAYAADGRFPEAVATAQKALELAHTSGDKQLADGISKNLQLYKTQRSIYTAP